MHALRDANDLREWNHACRRIQRKVRMYMCRHSAKAVEVLYRSFFKLPGPVQLQTTEQRS